MGHLKTLIFYTVFLTSSLDFIECASLKVSGRYEKFLGDEGLYKSTDDVEILTIDNFKNATTNSDRAWLVEFYNSWCGFCRRFAPSWKEFASNISGWQDLVVVAAVDCSNGKNYALCRDYEIMAYPTLKYFHEGFDGNNYGLTLNKGGTAEDHKEHLIKQIIKEQHENRGKQFPDLQPFTGSSIPELFNSAPSEVKYAVLLVQEFGSLLGPSLMLHLHKEHQLITKYTYSNNTELVSNFPTGVLPNLFVINRDTNKVNRIMARSQTDKDIIEALKEYFLQKGISFTTQVHVSKSAVVNEKKQVDDLLRIARNMADTVFQMDLESVLRYSLKREVGSSKEITGEKLQALRKYLQVLEKYFPFGANGKALLRQLSQLAESSDLVEGARIAKLMQEAEKETSQVFSTPPKWLGCEGSSGQYRRYPCGLWKLFHYLTVNVADVEKPHRETNPRLALEAMHGYIKHFFGCADCSQHFQDMAARRQLDQVTSSDDAILWLWEAHNEVNKRLSGDDTEDPEFPKIQFPSEKQCPQCIKSDEWDNNEVLKYLKQIYSSVNVRYLGADTKVIYLGLDGSSNSSGGFLNLDGSLYVIVYIAIFVLIFLIMNMFLKRGYRRKMYKYKHDLLGKV
ncbi:hypothetical protein ABEB36_000552 [Hypothenemus hampei]|uniref:Sulfhydryl oxidase n=1 Tax=Hypothenemus hampei TaxID=57062 RepID=A0ABD1FBQ5_HYPHA